MKRDRPSDVIYKDVVIIGNGPSGIVLSYILSGHVPYVISDAHPDEMLSARLRPAVGQCLLNQDLVHLSAGLEGRTANQVSLLMDALLHPCADVGLELEPLVEFRKNGYKIDHVVLGKGLPGGSWHHMDPEILTLSLGSWMALPGLKFTSRDSGEKRAYASTVAKYYVRYTEEMGLGDNFRSGVLVDSVEGREEEAAPEIIETENEKDRNWSRNMDQRFLRICNGQQEQESGRNRLCSISNAIECLILRSRRKKCRCKRSREKHADQEALLKQKPEIKRSVSVCCSARNICDNFNANPLRTYSNSGVSPVPFTCSISRCESRWSVNTTDLTTGAKQTYNSKYLILANGAMDQPNRLDCFKGRKDPDWLVYDLRTLEQKLDAYLKESGSEHIDPVLVIGAGLSAADAVIAMRGRDISVAHVFRNKSPDLSRHLAENLYPEYHKVHQMMLDGGSSYPSYTAYQEYNLADFDDRSRTVVLTSKEGNRTKLNVSFAVVLIGARPDLSFLPADFKLGTRKDLPVDCKTNVIDIDRFTYGVRGCENLFAIGPLVGDNFVRFLSGGALAVASELYRRNDLR